jgi:YbbR domain-containing protein
MSTVTENVDRELMLPITLPAGVSASDVTVVNVRVTLSTIDTRTIESVTLNAHDNYNNLAISNIDFTTVNVEVRGSTNNINSVEASDIEVYFIMPQEPGSYNLELFAELKNHPFVDISLERSTVNVTVVEANQ